MHWLGKEREARVCRRLNEFPVVTSEPKRERGRRRRQQISVKIGAAPATWLRPQARGGRRAAGRARSSCSRCCHRPSFLSRPSLLISTRGFLHPSYLLGTNLTCTLNQLKLIAFHNGALVSTSKVILFFRVQVLCAKIKAILFNRRNPW